MTLLEVQDLVKHYGSSRGVVEFAARRPAPLVHAVDGVSFKVSSHEMLALVGESGCGKTTTAQTVLRLLDPTSGTIRFQGKDITKLGQRKLRPLRQAIQIVYQDPYESLDPRYRVGQTIEEPLQVHGIGGTRSARRKLVLEALERVDLTPPALYADRYPHELSGGQRQRVAIAAALVVKPELVIADEPVSMLDVSVRAGILNLLTRLCREDGMGVLMITHDLGVAVHFADRIAVMYLGRIVEIGGARDVLRHPKHPYTQALCEVAPRRDVDPAAPRPKILSGEPANAAAIVSGCRFRPRCPVAVTACTHEDPDLRSVDDDGEHAAACLLMPKQADRQPGSEAARGDESD
jgi:oligopeptide/dipeptide ABC transporter ATP-binding protein